MNRLVSVIIPTINRPELLKLAVATVMQQDYPELEILISDNGSTDNTPEIIKAFAANDKRIRTRRNENTVDIISHVNECFAAARGEYAVILSDDDLVNAQFVSGLVRAFESDPDVTIAFPHCVSIDKEGVQQKDFGLPTWKIKQGARYVSDWLWSKESSFTGTFFTLFGRRQDILTVGGQPHFEKGLHSDNALLINLACAGKVAFATDALFYYRVYQQSSGLSAPYAQLAKASREFLSYLAHNPIPLDILSRLSFEESNLVLRGAAHMSALTYLWRVRDLYKLSGKDLEAALLVYQPDLEYLKNLKEFDFSQR